MKETRGRTSEPAHFQFAGHDTVRLAERYGTPLYVLSEDLIRDRCQTIREQFLNRHPDTQAAYASKAFLSMAMCRLVEQEGLWLDVVSGGELYTARQAGFPMDRVLFHGNNKSLDEMEMAVNYQVGRVVVDHPEEVRLLEKIAQSKKQRMTIQLRIVPEVEGKTHRHIMTGQKDSKFGIPMEGDLIRHTAKQAMDSSHLKLTGFHFHIGSNLFQQDVYRTAVRRVMGLYQTLKTELDFQATELNAGGGFGIRHLEEESVPPLSYFTEAIMEEVEACAREMKLARPVVMIEPGRWIVGEAGITLYRVGTVKPIPGVRTYVSVDGGLADNIRPALYHARYEAVAANKMNQPLTDKVTIAGKCCETGDILIWDQEVPALERGDVLAVRNTGAYTESMASNYNRLPRPAVVWLHKDQARLMIRRETYEDLLRRERESDLDEK